MNDSARLARQLELALLGGAWHGPSWKEILSDVDSAAALRRPVEGAHSIAEIAAHVATWNEVVRLRLEGDLPDVSDEQDWPPVPRLDRKSWEAAVARLLDQGTALRETVAAFPPERLHEQRPKTDDTWQDLVLGQLQHLLYHAGQAAILKRGL